MLSVLVKRLRRRHGRARSIAAAAVLGLPALLAVVGPGLLAGLSDDDPTTKKQLFIAPPQAIILMREIEGFA